MTDKCIMCGEVIPEGRQVCPKCENKTSLNGVELYLKFREELDRICVPTILNVLEHIEYIICDGKIVGLVGGNIGYIDVVYVLPEYRRKGLAKKAVLEWYNRYQSPYVHTKLHIINNNFPALHFWESIFDIREIEHNDIDTLYKIIRVKK